MECEIKIVKINKPENFNIIVGQAHFIKTVEDLYEVLVSSVPGIKFGLAFCEASGACKIRSEGTSHDLKKLAEENAANVAAGHTFFVILDGTYPINVLNAIKNLPEVCSIFSATANPLEIVVAESRLGRGIIGVIDGQMPKGVEDEKDVIWRKDLLRKIGYKK
ncbi:MAG TPA: adenosine-specific kinase [Candidatus Omnitrophota bacterium]|nr:adenosine-specific kinase [Candidatus Omnitrophota bacterium]